MNEQISLLNLSSSNAKNKKKIQTKKITKT